MKVLKHYGGLASISEFAAEKGGSVSGVWKAINAGRLEIATVGKSKAVFIILNSNNKSFEFDKSKSHR